MSVRPAESAAWQMVRDAVVHQLAARRAEIDVRLGLSFVKIQALRRLAGGCLSMGELATALDTDPPYACVVIDDLVQRELVVRSAHPDDRRRKLVGLTTTGAEYAATAESILDQPPAAFAAMDAEQLHALGTLFGRIGSATITTA
jgi:DNA-binding MarR family transcriptional regulator